MSLLTVIPSSGTEVRRWHFRDGVSKREIARCTGLSRNTIRRYLNSKVVAPAYPVRQSLSKLDEFEELLSGWLAREARRPRKQRKSVKGLYEDLLPLGYSGSYDRVAAFARRWRAEQQTRAGKHTYVPLSFEPGEAFQFDWGENWAVIGGHKVKLRVAHFKLCYSRAFYLRAYWSEAHEMLFDAHNHAFRIFNGVPERGIYDNMKTAVDKVGKGKQRTINKRFQAMASHYLFEPEFCNTAAGWEKGQVEKAVQDNRHRFWKPRPVFDTLDDLNDWLEAECLRHWAQCAHPVRRDRKVESLWKQERRQLMPVSASFDGYIEHTKRVFSTCLITFERNRYSVPASFANRLVSLHVYPAHLEMIAEGGLIATHARVFNRHHTAHGQTCYDWRHYLLVAQRKPGALRNGAPFKTLPEPFQQLQTSLLSRAGGDRDMVEILSLVLLHDEQLVLQAVEKAITAGAPNKVQVIHYLNRLLHPALPEPISTASHLQLTTEPLADTTHYDLLRGGKHAH